MFNPYQAMTPMPNFNGFNYPGIDNKAQQPIQNIINTTPLNGANDIFMARYLKPEENIDNIFINNRTAFIDLKNKELIVKELDGSKTQYELILPKDEKDLKIEALEKELKELKGNINNESNANVITNNEITKQNGII